MNTKIQTNQNFISVDKKTVRNSYGEFFTVGETVKHDDESAGEAVITEFEVIPERNEIRVYTDKGYAHIDFLVKKNATKLYEPFKKDRFLVLFPDKYKFPSYSVISIDKPVRIIGGQQQWQNIKIRFNDFIDQSTSQQLYNLLSSPEEDIKSNKSLFDIKIQCIDPTGMVVEEWVIQVGAIVEVNFGKLEYGNDSVQDLYMIITPFDCIKTL